MYTRNHTLFLLLPLTNVLNQSQKIQHFVTLTKDVNLHINLLTFFSFLGLSFLRPTFTIEGEMGNKTDKILLWRCPSRCLVKSLLCSEWMTTCTLQLNFRIGYIGKTPSQTCHSSTLSDAFASSRNLTLKSTTFLTVFVMFKSRYILYLLCLLYSLQLTPAYD